MNAINNTPRNAAFAALAKYKDPRFTPAPFVTSGILPEVLKAWKEAIAAEQCEDIELTPRALTFGERSGTLSADAGLTTRWGYTKHAITQLFERTGEAGQPTGALVTSFLWCTFPRRSILWTQEILARGDQDRTIIARTARNAHAAKIEGEEQFADARYVRANLSDQHAMTEGDDLLLIQNLEAAMAHAHMRDYANGRGGITRKPDARSYLWIDSSRALSHGARVRLNVVNSEVGIQSAGTSISIAFQVKVKGENREFEIAVVGDRSQSSAIHKGNGVAVLFDALAENLPYQTARALTAVPMLAARVSSFKIANLPFDEQEAAKVYAETLQDQGIAKGSSLSAACVLALLGRSREASEIYTNAEAGI